jgi:hypothetical protein
MKRFFKIIPFLLLLTACGGIIIPVQTGPGVATPSPLPAIRSPTSPFVPTSTSTPVETPLPPTETGSPTATFTASPTDTPSMTLSLLLEISGCNTSLDITHGMGEVTNAYPLLRNYTLSDLTNVCATLSASDEARVHPDKTACIPLLPAGNQVLLKLTVDTGFKQDTSIQVDVTSQEGQNTSASASSCRALGLPGWIPAKIGTIEPIP